MILPAIALLLAAAAPAQPVEAVPPSFLARWDTSELACDLRSGRTLEIHDDFVLFHETHGRVVSVVARGENEVMLVLEMKGERDTWLASLHLTLEGDVLVQHRDSHDGAPIRRIACPGTRAAVKGAAR